MKVCLHVTGYDRKTGFLVIEVDVPEEKRERIMRLAQMTPRQAADFGSLPLRGAVASDIGNVLGFQIEAHRCDWFLEPFAV